MPRVWRRKGGTPPVLSTRLAKSGDTAPKFDYRGFRASEGPRGGLVPAEQVEDAVDALALMSERMGLDPSGSASMERVFGGGIAILAARRSGIARAAVVTVPVTSGSNWLKSIFRWHEFIDLKQSDERHRDQGGHRRSTDGRPIDIMRPDPTTEARYTEKLALTLETFLLRADRRAGGRGSTAADTRSGDRRYRRPAGAVRSGRGSPRTAPRPKQLHVSMAITTSWSMTRRSHQLCNVRSPVDLYIATPLKLRRRNMESFLASRRIVMMLGAFVVGASFVGSALAQQHGKVRLAYASVAPGSDHFYSPGTARLFKRAGHRSGDPDFRRRRCGGGVRRFGSGGHRLGLHGSRAGFCDERRSLKAVDL